jgi:hypothetical protein
MESLKKISKFLFQPWSTILKPQISPLAKAVVVGCAASSLVFAAGWTLFASSSDLKHRNVFSVLVGPDYRFTEGRPERWAIVGKCSSRFPPELQPPLAPLIPMSLPSGEYSKYGGKKICGNWTEIKEPSFFGGTVSSWTAVEYLHTPGWPARSEGSSRSDALEHVKDVWVDAISSLLMPLVGLLVVHMGVLLGYLYFRRSSKMGMGDGEAS